MINLWKVKGNYSHSLVLTERIHQNQAMTNIASFSSEQVEELLTKRIFLNQDGTWIKILYQKQGQSKIEVWCYRDVTF